MQSHEHFLAEIILIMALTAITNATVVSAQPSMGSFNPQTQLQVGSRIIIRSVYGIATPAPATSQARVNLPTGMELCKTYPPTMHQ